MNKPAEIKRNLMHKMNVVGAKHLTILRKLALSFILIINRLHR